MVRIQFTNVDGQVEEIEASPGESLMANAKARGIRGIEAECGGSMVCGTCHVYIDQPWFGAIGAVPPMEAEMLEYVIAPKPNSRLSCQVLVTDEMDGMHVGLPPSQR